MIPISIIAILSYLIGSIPTSIIVARKARGIDIRHYGSGNAGGRMSSGSWLEARPIRHRLDMAKE